VNDRDDPFAPNLRLAETPHEDGGAIAGVQPLPFRPVDPEAQAGSRLGRRSLHGRRGLRAFLADATGERAGTLGVH
jgi:hypothetical protein